MRHFLGVLKLKFYDFFLLENLDGNEKNEIISTFSSPVCFKKGETIYNNSRFKSAIGYIIKVQQPRFLTTKITHTLKPFQKVCPLGQRHFSVEMTVI